MFPKRFVPKTEIKEEVEKAILPRDFTREVPASGWKWLLQYGLPYSYWKPFTGYSPAEERLVLTVGNPIKFSQGRYLGNDGGEKDGRGKWTRRPPRKWFFWGDGHGFVEVLGKTEDRSSEVVLVEDLISAHKVAQVTPTICLFGTNVHDLAIKELQALKRPVVLWLDGDQYSLLPKKINRLQTFLRHPVRYIYTEKDPKMFSTEEIRNILTQ